MFTARLATVLLALFLAMAGIVPAHSAAPLGPAEQYVPTPPGQAPKTPFTVMDSKGDSVQLTTLLQRDFRGLPVLVVFWANWCPLCVEEMTALDTLARAGHGQMGVLPIAMQNDGAIVVPAFYKRHGIRTLGIYWSQELARMATMGLRGLPTAIWYDAQGIERGRINGSARYDAPDALAFLMAQTH